MVDVVVHEVVEVVPVVVVALEVVVLEVAQPLEDDVVGLEAEHPAVAQCPPPSGGCCSCRSLVAMFCF